jgi:hypothetical protein
VLAWKTFAFCVSLDDFGRDIKELLHFFLNLENSLVIAALTDSADLEDHFEPTFS